MGGVREATQTAWLPPRLAVVTCRRFAAVAGRRRFAAVTDLRRFAAVGGTPRKINGSGEVQAFRLETDLRSRGRTRRRRNHAASVTLYRFYLPLMLRFIKARLLLLYRFGTREKDVEKRAH